MVDGSGQAAWKVPSAFGCSRAYGVAWAIALLLAIVAPSFGAVVGFTSSPAWTPYGVTTGFQFRVIWEVFGNEARASGIARGDQVLAINEVSIEQIGPARGAIRKALAGRPGKSVVLTLRRPSTGTTTRHFLRWRHENVATGERFAGRLTEGGSMTVAVLGIMQALILVVSAALLFTRRRDPVAATISISLLLIAGGYGLSERTFYEVGLFRTQLAVSFTGFSLLLLALLTFPAGKFEPRWTVAAAMLVPAWALMGFLLNSQAQMVVAFGYVGLSGIALLAIRQRYRKFATDAERQQVRWFLLGFALFLCCVCVQLPLVARGSLVAGPSGRVLLEWGRVFAFLSTVAFNGGLVISLLKYRLYDANTAIGRSVTYGVLTLGLLGIFAGSEKIIEILGEEYFGDRLGAFAGGLGAAVAAVMIAPLHHRITHWAEHRFQKNLLRLRRELPLLAGDLRETASAERIAGAIIEEAGDTVRAARAAVLLGEDIKAVRGIDRTTVEEWRGSWRMPTHTGLDCDRDDAVFPIRIPLDAAGHGRVGWLLLGPRPDGSFYGKDERQALAEIADPVARALAVSSERAEERSRLEDALANLIGRVSVVEQQLATARQA